MSWTEDDSHPFAGIAKKLERADENIVNLHSEILTFFKASKYPVLPDTNDKSWQEGVNYHRELQIPKRFSVLAGEIIHHLRSCLDHIVWHFSSDAARRLHENTLEFPILRKPPTKDELTRYDRKIQGITNANVRALIERLQPYQRGADAVGDPLCIIHDMDRFDKHRELVIVTTCANLTFPPGTSLNVIADVLAYRKGETLSNADLAIARRAIKQNAKVTPQIAFAQFGKGETQFVVPALTYLLKAVDDVVELFEREI